MKADTVLASTKMTSVSRQRVAAGLALIVLAVAAIGFPLVFSSPVVTNYAIYALIFVAAVSAWNVFSGFSGYISLGHAVFFGSGAYTVGIAARDWHINGVAVFGLLPLAAAVGAVIAVPFGLVALRVRRHTFIVITIAVFFIFQLMAYNFSFTGGSVGVSAPFLPWSPTSFNDRFYYITLGCAVGMIVIAVLVRRSRFGLQLRAIRDDEDRARGLGVHAMRVKLTAFVLSGTVMALVGGVWFLYLTQVEPPSGIRPAVRPGPRADGVPGRPRDHHRPDSRRAHHRTRPALPDHQIHQRVPQRDPARRAVPPHRAVRAARPRPDHRRMDQAAADQGPPRGWPVRRAPAARALRLPEGQRSAREGGQKMSALLRTEGVRKAYGGVHALDSCTVEIDEGSVAGLIGPNGSGKTTLFNVITGYAKADAGQVYLADKKITNIAPEKVFARGIGRTFQLTRIFASLTVLENMLVASKHGGAAARKRAMEQLEFVGIAGHHAALAGTLSYGQRKLLELAYVLVSDPAVILLDEPAGGVNLSLVNHIADRIRELNAAGKTFLIVEHNMEFVMGLCDRVTVLDSGAVVAAGPPDIIRTDRRVLNAYLGEDLEDDDPDPGEEHDGASQDPVPGAGASTTARSVLKIEDLVAGYGGGDVLRGVSLEVAEGGITCVVGPNGAGKSTLMSSISGLLRPRLGSITLTGRTSSACRRARSCASAWCRCRRTTACSVT